MSDEPSLDISYRLNPRIVGTIKSADTLAVLGTGTPLELPLDLFQVVMAFAEPKTARQAFQMLDADIGLDEFAGIITRLFDCDLLRREQPDGDEPSLRQLLNPAIVSDPALADHLAGWLRQGRAIVIPDALPLDLAERVHGELDRSRRWSVGEGAHDFFHFRSCGIASLEGHSPALTECSRVFGSAATRRFIAELSGCDCSGEAGIAAAWYRPGEYALPHDDSAASASRSVAYIWYLTKDWRQEWGGALFWCPTGQYVAPRFNVLTIFKVLPSNLHLICPVAPSATGKRLTINGFWNRAGRGSPRPAIPPDVVVSDRAYGQPAPELPENCPLMVL